ncbi:MAG TPA: hypothetical protein PK358_01680 [Spirochaetota bacterium]|nr:hypothetical protein [Spirochaetota bacterium]HPJ33513.1 hypothetical protein [Spirochaetota bacterium]
MKLFIKQAMLLILTAAVSVPVSAKKNNPEIKLSAVLNRVSEASYTIDYRASLSGIDSSVFKEQTIYYPYETSIIEGQVIDKKLRERDFLYSERNIDLNNDGDFKDEFTVSFKGGYFAVSGRKTDILYKKNNGSTVMIPFLKNNRENAIKVADGGLLFTVHSFDPLAGRITAGIGNRESSLFRSSPNGLIYIEIIQNDSETAGDVTVNGAKPDSGFTNEKLFTPGGENLKRFFMVLNAPLENNTSSGSIKIKNNSSHFRIRLRYLFSISRRIILTDEKILIWKTR